MVVERERPNITRNDRGILVVFFLLTGEQIGEKVNPIVKYATRCQNCLLQNLPCDYERVDKRCMKCDENGYRQLITHCSSDKHNYGPTAGDRMEHVKKKVINHPE